MAFMFTSRALALFLLLIIVRAASAKTPYWVRVVDADTSHGVPLVQFTANSVNYWTDSNGVLAIEDKALQEQDVTFGIHSDGYEFEQKVQGEPGKVLHVQAGNHDQVKIKRLDIAERLYRVTGADISRYCAGRA